MSDGPKGCVLQITSAAALVLDLTLQRWCRGVRQPGERRVSHRVKLQGWNQKTSASFQDNWHIWHNFPWHRSHCCYSYSHVDILSSVLLLLPRRRRRKKNLRSCFPLLLISGSRLQAIWMWLFAEIPVSVFLSILMTALSGRNTVMCSTWLPVSQIFGSDYFIWADVMTPVPEPNLK